MEWIENRTRYCPFSQLHSLGYILPASLDKNGFAKGRRALHRISSVSLLSILMIGYHRTGPVQVRNSSTHKYPKTLRSASTGFDTFLTPNIRWHAACTISSRMRPMSWVLQNLTAPDSRKGTPLPMSDGIWRTPARKKARNILQYRAMSVRERRSKKFDVMNWADPRRLFCSPWCQKVL